ncbi:MAG: hypothetical protein ACYCX2_01995 [Christensenellales bacterium]
MKQTGSKAVCRLCMKQAVGAKNGKTIKGRENAEGSLQGESPKHSRKADDRQAAAHYLAVTAKAAWRRRHSF